MLRILTAALFALFAVPASAATFTFDAEMTQYHRFLDDFDDYVLADWVITAAEAGGQAAATEVTASVDGGALVLTNDDADNDNDFLQWSGSTNTAVVETFKFEVGKRLYFEARFKVLEVLQSDFVIGLQITDTAPLDVTDGIFFSKDDGDALLDFNVEKNNTATATAGVATMVADTYMTVAFYYNGSDADIDYLINGTVVGSAALTNVVDDEELTVSFGIQNGEAVINTMTIDYVLVAKERTLPQ